MYCNNNHKANSDIVLLEEDAPIADVNCVIMCNSWNSRSFLSLNGCWPFFSLFVNV